MQRIVALVQRYALTTFFVLAYVFVLVLVLLTSVSPAFGFLASARCARSLAGAGYV